MAALAKDLVLLLLQWQAVDLDDVVQHAGEDGDNLAEVLPVEARFRSKGLVNKTGQVDRTEQAGAVGRQRLLPAGVGGADLFAKPVVVHLIDLVDEDETRLGKIVSGRHDYVPQLFGADESINLAGDLSHVVLHVVIFDRPVLPEHLPRVINVQPVTFQFLGGQRETERPFLVFFNGFYKFVGNQKGKVELAQTAIFTLGLDKINNIRMRDVEGRHLCTATTTGRSDGTTHAVVDVHERQRPGGVGSGAVDKGVTWTQR